MDDDHRSDAPAALARNHRDDPEWQGGPDTYVSAFNAVALPRGHGYIDNLYLTPAGDIVLVETKLWVNAQARREVVAQALDYVAALAEMDHGTLEIAAGQSEGWRGGSSPFSFTLTRTVGTSRKITAPGD